MIKKTKTYISDLFLITFFFCLFFSNLYAATEITYKEILDNPTDLELNLNYAKQQESSGNLKLTIATLERLSMLYPESLDIKLYLLSILIKMDSKVKVDLMVRTMMNDPNTTAETKKLIAELLSDTGKQTKESKWFAYLDLKYSQTEQDNMSGITKTKQLLQENNKIPYSEIDSRLVVEYDKSYTRGSGLTFGKNIDNSSSMFFNLGLDINTLNKKIKGDSDIFSGSLSYFKIIDEHYISPYVYYNKPNYRKQEDYETVGVGFNNTWIINEKNNINYGLGISNTEYVINTSEGFETASDNNNDVYSSFIRYNYNLTKKIQIGTKLILNRTESRKEFDSYDARGINLSYSHILPFGTLKLRSTYLKNAYDEPETFVSSTIIRNDDSFVASISLEGQLIKLLPLLKRFKIDDSLLYTLNMKHSDVSSNVINHDIERNYKTIGLTKRINLNGLF